MERAAKLRRDHDDLWTCSRVKVVNSRASNSSDSPQCPALPVAAVQHDLPARIASHNNNGYNSPAVQYEDIRNGALPREPQLKSVLC